MKSKRGKKYREVKKSVEPKPYGVSEAVSLLKKTSPVKFDATCEVHLRLNVDPKHADQLVRGVVSLPHGTGKKVKVIAFVPEALEKTAKEAGADDAGLHLVDKIAKGWMDFDVAVATPDVMKSLGKIVKTLGQKGLMPNPKAGTVGPDVKKIIEEIKKGRVEYRVDAQGIIHNIFGKVSFSQEHLEENFKVFLRAIASAKPASVKGTFIKSLDVTTSMGPGIKVDANKAFADL